MTDRQASFLICDELLVSLNGKFFIQGVYTGDIVIAAEEQRLNQLILFLQISTPTQRPFRQLELRLSIPGEENPRVVDLMPLLPTIFTLPGRTTSSYKVPVPIVFPNLKTGPIEVRLTHEEGELFVGRQWVMAPTQAQEIQKQLAGVQGTTLRN
jgi:hypothetical protein